MRQSSIVWVHADSLNPDGAVFKANPKAPAIFVFDEVLLREYNLSLKRMVFLYECLLQMPVTLRKGEVAEQVLLFAQEHGAQAIHTTYSPSPRFAQIAKQIARRQPNLRVYQKPDFAEDRAYDLKRFSRYWAQARASALGT